MSKKASPSFLFIIALLPALIMTAIVFFVIPMFKDMYAAFGTELPAATRAVLNFAGLLPLLSFSFMPVWLFWPERPKHRILAMNTSIIVNAVLFISTMALCYQPLINMSATIG